MAVTGYDIILPRPAARIGEQKAPAEVPPANVVFWGSGPLERDALVWVCAYCQGLRPASQLRCEGCGATR